MLRSTRLAAASMLVLGGAAPVASAQTATAPERPPEVKDWRITLAPYAWAAALDGDVGIGPLEGDLDMSFNDILDDLTFAGFILLDAQKGPWIASLNLAAVRTEDEVGDVLRTRNDMVNLGGSIAYQAVDVEVARDENDQPLSFRLAPLVGVRLNYLRLELESRVAGQREADRSEVFVDPLAGVRGGVDLTRHLKLVAEADIGGFGVGSDLAWNVQGFVTYRTSIFGLSSDLALGWRALSIDYDSGNFKYDAVTSGPVIGATLNF